MLSARPIPQEDNECDFDEELNGERNEILQDDDLFDIIVENSLQEQDPFLNSEIASAVLGNLDGHFWDDC